MVHPPAHIPLHSHTHRQTNKHIHTLRRTPSQTHPHTPTVTQTHPCVHSHTCTHSHPCTLASDHTFTIRTHTYTWRYCTATGCFAHIWQWAGRLRGEGMHVSMQAVHMATNFRRDGDMLSYGSHEEDENTRLRENPRKRE